jgi:hypothetical protein
MERSKRGASFAYVSCHLLTFATGSCTDGRGWRNWLRASQKSGSHRFRISLHSGSRHHRPEQFEPAIPLPPGAHQEVESLGKAFNGSYTGLADLIS